MTISEPVDHVERAVSEPVLPASDGGQRDG